MNVLIDIESDYRFVTYRNYLAFYHLGNNVVNIDRVLYKGQDCVKALFLE